VPKVPSSSEHATTGDLSNADSRATAGFDVERPTDAAVCSTCGGAVAVEARYCPECGANREQELAAEALAFGGSPPLRDLIPPTWILGLLLAALAAAIGVLALGLWAAALLILALATLYGVAWARRAHDIHPGREALVAAIGSALGSVVSLYLGAWPDALVLLLAAAILTLCFAQGPGQTLAPQRTLAGVVLLAASAGLALLANGHWQTATVVCASALLLAASTDAAARRGLAPRPLAAALRTHSTASLRLLRLRRELASLESRREQALYVLGDAVYRATAEPAAAGRSELQELARLSSAKESEIEAVVAHVHAEVERVRREAQPTRIVLAGSDDGAERS
jgi:hypothetical protein